MILIPVPKSVKWHEDYLQLGNIYQIIQDDIACLEKAVKKLTRVMNEKDYKITCDQGISIQFNKDEALCEEQYKININKAGIIISYATECGAFNAISTLKQIMMQSTNNLQCVEIFDEPDFPNRGLMLDASRNRVHKVSTVLSIIDFLSDLKCNQLQFNIEGNAYYYPSKDKYYTNPNDYFTAEDFKLIDEYCKENCIRFIPNQNSLGHMSYWLSKEEFIHLAECPEGFSYMWLVNSPASTLNPLLKESVEFVTGLYDEMIVGFNETVFNIGGDEPFELGLGASKEVCEKETKQRVYLDFILKLKQHLNNKGYKIMMWGDVIKNHPDLLDYMPKDIIALEWGYDANDFSDEICQKYVQAGFDYYVCPGTSMWNSVAGIHQNMLSNIKRAAKFGYRNKAIGLLNTDWADGGSWQQLSLSYFPYAIGCAYSWNSSVDQDELILDYLDKFIYKDNQQKLARIIYDLGSYSKIEKIKQPNSTHLFKLLYLQQTDNFIFDLNPSDPMAIIKENHKISNEEYKSYISFFKSILERLKECDIQSLDKELIIHEVLFGTKILLVGALLGYYQTDLYSHNKNDFNQMIKYLEEAIEHFNFTWAHRNKPSDYKLSIYRMKLLLKKLKLIVCDNI